MVVGAAVVVVGCGRVVVVVEGFALVAGVVAGGTFAGLIVDDPQPASMSSTAAAVGRHALPPRISASCRLEQSLRSAGRREFFGAGVRSW
jgi:hypothetical protein